jgi:trehalose 6-phosphate synthase
VTPLRDGMNLVAKEFVAAQDPADPGVLILSRFAGAAEELSDALLVNPYDPDDIADAMNAALEMSLEERQERHAALRRAVFEVTSARYCDVFTQALAG